MTKEEIKAITSVPEVLERYGVEVRRGRCKSICHDGKKYTAKVSRDLYFCFKCNESMDIFDIVMHFNNCDFKTAFSILGGDDKPSFTARIKANQSRISRRNKLIRKQKEKAILKEIETYITAYRKIIAENEPFSDPWSYCQHKLQYQLYLYEYYTRKR